MEYIWVIFSLIGVLGLFFLLIYALGKFNKKIGAVSGSGIRVLDRVSIGRDGMIFVVSVGGKLMLLSATSQRVEKLCDLDMTPEEYRLQLDENPQQGSFASVFASVLARNSGKTVSKKENDDD